MEADNNQCYQVRTIVSILDNGARLTAQDTVPFALWCAAHHTDDFEEAIWTAVSGLGDRDTLAAIVGSIVVLTAGQFSIPLQ
jgi:ADP-ribosylglycohydrolase